MSGAGPARRPLSFAVGAMEAEVLAGGASAKGVFFAGAATDSRGVTPGRLFFALRGERVDGFAFCAGAAAAGAAAVIVQRGRGVPEGCSNLPVLAVADPRLALGALARAVRARFGGQVVGITGSNGKTTTKELVAAALGASGAVLRTAGNLNTDVGLPLTVLEASGDERYWVLEMAMRARGEIAYLADLALPHVGVVTNVAAAHLGRLGSLEEVAKAKGEIFSGLADGGIAVLPANDPLLEAEAEHLPESRKRRFGGWGLKSMGPVADPGDVRILDFAPSGTDGSIVRYAVGDEPVVVRLPLPGEHNARNAATALAVVRALGLSVRPAAAALARAALPAHRSRIVPVGGRTVLDDCYNANPASMLAALRTLTSSAGASGQAFAVIGDMLELGPEAEALHADIGRQAVGLGVAGLIAVGALATKVAEGARAAGLAADRVRAMLEPAEAADTVAGWSAPGDWILIKASRGLRLERVLEALEKRFPAPPPPSPVVQAAVGAAATATATAVSATARKPVRPRAAPTERKMTGKPAGKPGTKPVARPAAKPATKAPTKPAAKPATKPASAKAAKPAAKPATAARKPASRGAAAVRAGKKRAGSKPDKTARAPKKPAKTRQQRRPRRE